MTFISITGAIKWDIFVFYIVSGVIFVTCICVIVSCLFLCCPAASPSNSYAAKYNRLRKRRFTTNLKMAGLGQSFDSLQHHGGFNSEDDAEMS